MKLRIKHHGNYLEDIYRKIDEISSFMNTFFKVKELLHCSNHHSLNDHGSKNISIPQIIKTQNSCPRKIDLIFIEQILVSIS
jgi:hypothetical protein